MRSIRQLSQRKFSFSWWQNAIVNTLGPLLLVIWILCSIAFAVVSIITGWPSSGVFIAVAATLIAAALWVRTMIFHALDHAPLINSADSTVSQKSKLTA